ncbi:hypothetical protein MBLNU230_g2305t1 [Neophaeotheca triangularis]
MTTPKSPPNFTLDKNIFNAQLYARLHDFWFEGLTPTTLPGPQHFTRWFGANATDSEKAALDAQCYDNFGTALEALGPSHLQLPVPQTANERGVPDPTTDVETNITAPLIPEITSAPNPAHTLLSLIILLDQIPRNTYRSPQTLGLVYTHYDRLAHALVLHPVAQNLLTPTHSTSPLTPVEKAWALMPLMHSEHLPSHNLYAQLIGDEKAEAEARGEEGWKGYLQRSLGAAESHRGMVERFGRYPYRNEFVGRVGTEAEAEYLASEGAESFGVVEGMKGQGSREREESAREGSGGKSEL